LRFSRSVPEIRPSTTSFQRTQRSNDIFRFTLMNYGISSFLLYCVIDWEEVDFLYVYWVGCEYISAAIATFSLVFSSSTVACTSLFL
jgi:hypothetical protein